jgi:hypothetical protein
VCDRFVRYSVKPLFFTGLINQLQLQLRTEIPVTQFAVKVELMHALIQPLGINILRGLCHYHASINKALCNNSIRKIGGSCPN